MAASRLLRQYLVVDVPTLTALTALASVVISGVLAALTQVSRRDDRKHIERLRALDWEHGRSSRRREAYLAVLEQGVLLLGANQDDVKQLSKATSQVELYGTKRAAELWREFRDLSEAGDADARTAYDAFASQAREEDEQMDRDIQSGTRRSAVR